MTYDFDGKPKAKFPYETLDPREHAKKKKYAAMSRSLSCPRAPSPSSRFTTVVAKHTAAVIPRVAVPLRAAAAILRATVPSRTPHAVRCASMPCAAVSPAPLLAGIGVEGAGALAAAKEDGSGGAGGSCEVECGGSRGESDRR